MGPPPFGLAKVSKNLEIQFTYSASMFATEGNGYIGYMDISLCASAMGGSFCKSK